MFRILQVLKFLLVPFSWIYGAVIHLRRYLYQKNIFPSQTFNLPVVVIGNLSVGGTGKTPHVLWFLQNFSNQCQCVYLSRGYGRSTRGLRIVTEEDDARSVGDEAKWIFDNSNCIVVVGENRKHAIQNIKILFPEIDMIFMDDGLQHLSIIPSVKILLTDRNRLFIHDHLLPYGRLREHKKNAHDVDCIIVTKCEDDFNCDQKSLDELSAYRKPIFFSQYQYQSPRKMFHRERINSLPQRMILVTGIADVTYLLKYVGQSSIIKHFEFSDHHAFTRSEIVMIDTLQKETNAAVITTAKDEMRLMMFSSVITNLENWMVLDIDVMIHEPQKLLDIILDKIK